jgi:hypothetical protein
VGVGKADIVENGELRVENENVACHSERSEESQVEKILK